MAHLLSLPKFAALWLLLGILPYVMCAKIYLCGDSTMARGNKVIDGWGQYAQPFFSVPVVNKAIGGRSARSYTGEGRFNEVAKLVQPGDTVVIEFGHNDGGSLKNDNGRSDCSGTGSETCNSQYKGKQVVVQTFPTYMLNAGKLFTSKQAHVVFSSMTPNNIWEGGKGTYAPSRFTEFARDAAKAIGKGASFVDHGAYVAKEYKALGASKVNALYPQDHTHTNEAGAKIVAKAFIQALVAANDPLTKLLKADGKGGREAR